MRWASRVAAAPTRLKSPPTLPWRSSASCSSEGRRSTESRFNWPSFSSRVMRASRESIARSVVWPAAAPAVRIDIAIASAGARLWRRRIRVIGFGRGSWWNVACQSIGSVEQRAVLSRRCLDKRPSGRDNRCVSVPVQPRSRVRPMNLRQRLATALGALVLLLPTTTASAQTGPFRVTGTVTSAADGSPLSGARVVVKGTTVATLTGANGRYAIDAPSPNDSMAFAFIGYRPQTVGIAGRPVVNVAMEAAAILMEEVVVTGYGTQQRRDVTGAVATLKSEDLTPLPAASVDQTLQGRVPGVQVTPSSGRPGASAIVRIRGVGTLNDASPLYVVDGMLLDDISFLQANEVASVEVLKDASATAIYGSRGANGVIIISTKRGTLERPTRFSVSAYTGSQSVMHRISLVDARRYATLANEEAANATPTPLPPYFSNPDTFGVGTNWQDAIFQAAPI